MKYALGCVGVGLGLIAAGTAQAQISRSRHNFASSGWSGGEICKPCHTPHMANPAAGALWNHWLTTASYTLYDGTHGSYLDVDARSRLCMGCHDGTVAIDSYDGRSAGTNYVGPRDRIGTDLRDDHPIGSKAQYPTDVTGLDFKAFSTGVVNGEQSAWVPNGSLRLYLRSWTDSSSTRHWVVGCSSCHDVHNAGNRAYMLNLSTGNSALCLTCHVK